LAQAHRSGLRPNCPSSGGQVRGMRSLGRRPQLQDSITDELESLLCRRGPQWRGVEASSASTLQLAMMPQPPVPGLPASVGASAASPLSDCRRCDASEASWTLEEPWRQSRTFLPTPSPQRLLRPFSADSAARSDEAPAAPSGWSTASEAPNGWSFAAPTKVFDVGSDAVPGSPASEMTGIGKWKPQKFHKGLWGEPLGLATKRELFGRGQNEGSSSPCPETLKADSEAESLEKAGATLRLELQATESRWRAAAQARASEDARVEELRKRAERLFREGPDAPEECAEIAQIEASLLSLSERRQSLRSERGELLGRAEGRAQDVEAAAHVLHGLLTPRAAAESGTGGNSPRSALAYLASLHGRLSALASGAARRSGAGGGGLLAAELRAARCELASQQEDLRRQRDTRARADAGTAQDEASISRVQQEIVTLRGRLEELQMGVAASSTSSSRCSWPADDRLHGLSDVGPKNPPYSGEVAVDPTPKSVLVAPSIGQATSPLHEGLRLLAEDCGKLQELRQRWRTAVQELSTEQRWLGPRQPVALRPDVSVLEPAPLALPQS